MGWAGRLGRTVRGLGREVRERPPQEGSRMLRERNDHGGKNTGSAWPLRDGPLLTSDPAGPATEGPLGSQKPHQATTWGRVLTSALVQQEGAEMCSSRSAVTYLDFPLFPYISRCHHVDTPGAIMVPHATWEGSRSAASPYDPQQLGHVFACSSTTLGSAGFEAGVARKEETPVIPLNWNLRQSPGYWGLFMPSSEQAEKEDKC